ncbi:MAG: alanine--tRNA ligase, partial [Candidatus Marinimicrobia bacterium]|nr:alanine--tRNA ligase [Candidatus Neomarinimicrobiota bacterium]
QPIIQKIEKLSGINYIENQVPFQVIADHIRMLCFSIADGAIPSNEGRGYVLRRILRRAARFGRILKLEEPFLYKLVPTVCGHMSEAYPELKKKDTHIELVIGTEETLFNQTLDRGINHLDKLINDLDGKTIPGADAFKLYDTYGFPIDLTQLIAREKGIDVDEDGFNEEMSQQKYKARQSGKFRLEEKDVVWNEKSDGKDSEFIGYEHLECESNVRKYAKIETGYLIVLDKTPFYAESGGQVSDRGIIKANGIDLNVTDVQKDNDVIIHICTGKATSLDNIDSVTCEVDIEYRNSIKRNHTATHLLHASLKIVIGDHVQQAGSLVHPEYLRFDLTCFEKITPGQIHEIEKLVNSEILINNNLKVSTKSYDEAMKDGVVALFGEKYGDQVRVVSTGEFSSELCGGTHVNSTGDIGMFKITEESSLASGVRRIIAITGNAALEAFQNKSDILSDIQLKLNCKEEDLLQRVTQLYNDKKELDKKIKQLNQTNESDISLWIKNSKNIGDFKLVIELLEISDIDEIKRSGDKLLEHIGSGIGILFSSGDDKPFAVIVLTDDLIKNGLNAGKLAKEIGAFMGGGGGGKPHIATAGGRDKTLVKNAIDQTQKLISRSLKF